MNHCDVCILDNLREYTNSGVIDVKRFLKTRTNHSPHYILFNNKPVEAIIIVILTFLE